MLLGIIGGIVGTVVVLAASLALSFRGRAEFAPGKLRTLQGQATETVGPFGAFVFFMGAGVFVITVVAIPFGEAIALLDGPVDHSVYRWVERHQTDGWYDALLAIGQMGDMYQIWSFGLIAGALLTFLAPAGRRWVPVTVMLTTIVVEHFQQMGMSRIVDRGHPPNTTGTFPSGGCARLICITGMAMFLLFAYVKVSKRVRGICWALLATLAYVEGFTRLYVSKHWLTDIPAGWLYGAVLLVTLAFAVRPLLAPAVAATSPVGDERAIKSDVLT
ncbi:phosphatase PAP2 family protein [Actinomadura rudentiformis]|uniref:Phosphatase PAP2 family protein n=1 Tax=Actinomadura rudentiformis TaxID=359158 RepID=A0A6H9YGL3_9ACTN|nr:phosphatase PAP2 family protein [Actinomadura rudentiformis]KAB2344028.1 phosphatase PAP2 family protein [Actinomadura rudentiformis]